MAASAAASLLGRKKGLTRMPTLPRNRGCSNRLRIPDTGEKALIQQPRPPLELVEAAAISEAAALFSLYAEFSRRFWSGRLERNFARARQRRSPRTMRGQKPEPRCWRLISRKTCPRQKLILRAQFKSHVTHSQNCLTCVAAWQPRIA
jgi:hypothetical protein